MDKHKLEKNVKELLVLVGEDPTRSGLHETPRRVADYYEEMLAGYKEDPYDHATTFPSEGDHGLVVVRAINFYSLCEHHLVPFFGEVSIGYLPNGKLLGLSKFARIVEVYAKRLQVQERLTNQILNTIVDIMHPQGCAVLIQAKHLCMAMRGIKNDTSSTVTTKFYGKLEKDIRLRREFLDSIQHPK